MQFNMLLETAGIDPLQVKLVRHQDRRVTGRSPYGLWQAADGSLEAYQSLQSRQVFEGASFVASFVATPLNETLFVGLYEITGKEAAPNTSTCPLHGQVIADHTKYDLRLRHELSDCIGRLIIDWGQGYIAWVQRAGQQNKPILELRRHAGEKPFPGFLAFRQLLSEFENIPLSWREALSSVSGVYLLACPVTGKQYIGSAYGTGGFWSRWEAYVANGHGGNKLMREVPRADYQVSILEVAASSASDSAIIQCEERWKEKLLTKTFGLNSQSAHPTAPCE